MRDNSERPAQQSYLYSNVLEHYLEEKLEVEKLKRSAERSGKELSKSQKQRVKANDKNKVLVLNNHIFRSMANLVYFFEFINKHHELESVFDSDVEDLFGLRGPHIKRHKVDDGKYLIILRFLDAILGYDNEKLVVKENDSIIYSNRRVKKKKRFDTSRNIRLQLIAAVTDAATFYIQNLAGEKEGDTASLAHLKIYKIIGQDLERTSIWKDYYCTSQIRLNTNNPHRKIAF
jgi:hypothetical protein